MFTLGKIRIKYLINEKKMKIFLGYFLCLQIKYQSQRKNKNAKIMKIKSNGPRGAESELGVSKAKKSRPSPESTSSSSFEQQRARVMYKMLSPDSMLFDKTHNMKLVEHDHTILTI